MDRMARYKDYSYDQQKLLPVRYSEQILPGTFEYTLGYVIDHEIDLSVFDARYRNDEGGAPAYDPRILLKIILFAYSRGVVSSRRIESLCRENVVMMALSADTQPHWTTISELISSSHEEVVMLFREVLTYCDALGLIGKELFAIDGLKLPSNAAKEWSGTRADLKKKQRKLEQTVRTMLAAHRARDAAETDAPPRERASAREGAQDQGIPRHGQREPRAERHDPPRQYHRPPKRQDENVARGDPRLHRGGRGRWQAPSDCARRRPRRGPGTRAARAHGRRAARESEGGGGEPRCLVQGPPHRRCWLRQRSQHEVCLRGRHRCLHRRHPISKTRSALRERPTAQGARAEGKRRLSFVPARGLSPRSGTEDLY